MVEKRTELSKLGEFGLIERLTRDVNIKHASTIKGVGDDAAVLDFKNRQVVVTTDLLVEGIHFNLMYTPLKHLGYKAVVVNLSDVCAMNAQPRQITVSLAVSGRFFLEDMEELYAGIKKACECYQVDLVGGDTTSSLTGLMISITAIGEADKEEIVYRNGANVNDLICVTGDLGGAYMGLQLLEREREMFESNPGLQPKLTGRDYIIGRQLKPEARLDIIGMFKELEVKPTAMIDISDGLSSEILHICKASNTGCKLYHDKIPMDNATIKMAEEFEIDPTVAALNGGEDYELLFTLPLADYDKVNNHPDFTIIGHIAKKEEGTMLVMPHGQEIGLIAQGWNAMG